MKTIADPYSSGVLDPDTHGRLVADLKGFAADAGIMPSWIYEPLPDPISSQELDFLQQFRRPDSGGLVYTGDHNPVWLEDRMSHLAGVLVRNFIRARVLSLGTILDALRSHQQVDATCLLIPNFCQGQEHGSSLASWQASALLDLLLDRRQRRLKTVVFARNMNVLGKEYGMAFVDLLKADYQFV